MISPGAVTAVTVTYGRRWKLLEKVIRAALTEGCGRVVVVDNGSQDDIAAMVLENFDSTVDVVRSERNAGSASGFRMGLERAVVLKAQFLLLLDDDNEIQPGGISALIDSWSALSRSVSSSSLAVLAFRADRQSEALAQIPFIGLDDRTRAFFGFEVQNIPFKVFRRTGVGRRWMSRRTPSEQVVVAIAPYSGMFFHSDVIERHGLPDERFVLYADDTEFSYRLTQAGGRIVIVAKAALLDLQPSWDLKQSFGNHFDALLSGQDDFRAYYSTRNNAYFERWSRDGGDGVVRRLNRAIFLTVLALRAAGTGRLRRFELLLGAVRDGEAQRLGESTRYPLN